MDRREKEETGERKREKECCTEFTEACLRQAGTENTEEERR